MDGDGGAGQLTEPLDDGEAETYAPAVFIVISLQLIELLKERVPAPIQGFRSLCLQQRGWRAPRSHPRKRAHILLRWRCGFWLG